MSMMQRRHFFKKILTLSTATAVVLTSPIAFAQWAEATFKAKNFDAAMAAIGADKAEESDKITLKAPEIAENGQVVPITISTSIQGASELHLLVKENPSPLAASFTLGELAVPQVKSRIKMGKASDIVAVVKAGDKVYITTKWVKVTQGGCGGG